MNVFRNILAKNQNFKKLRHSFVDERALKTTTLISSCHWKTLLPFVSYLMIYDAIYLLLV